MDFKLGHYQESCGLCRLTSRCYDIRLCRPMFGMKSTATGSFPAARTIMLPASSFAMLRRGQGLAFIFLKSAGAGNNLAFLVGEGFRCSGYDANRTAIEYARHRIGAAADLRVACFPEVPFPDTQFDLIVERAALCYADFPTALETVSTLRRKLKPGGKFLFTPYTEHADAPGVMWWCDRDIVEQLFAGWTVLSLTSAIYRDEIAGKILWGELRVIVQS